MFYAQSWLLTHYLYCGNNPKIKGKFAQFLNAINDTPLEIEGCFQQVYGMSSSQLQLELRGYLDGGQFHLVTGNFPIGDFSDKIHFEPVSEIERSVALENLRWRASRTDDGAAYRLMALAERDPKLAKTYEVLASFTYKKERDRRQAEGYWTKAVECGSTNAYVYLQLAKADMSAAKEVSSLDYRMPQVTCDVLRKNLDRAVELRPDYLEAWSALAQVEAFAVKPRTPVLNQLKAYLPLMRSQTRANTLASIAVFAWRQRDVGTCRALMAMAEEAKPGPSAKNLLRLINKKLALAEQKKAESEPAEETLKPIDRS